MQIKENISYLRKHCLLKLLIHSGDIVLESHNHMKLNIDSMLSIRSMHSYKEFWLLDKVTDYMRFDQLLIQYTHNRCKFLFFKNKFLNDMK